MLNYSKLVPSGMRITQGRNTGTHINAYDEASKDTGKSILYAPCDLKVVAFEKIDGAYYTVFESVNNVKLRNNKSVKAQFFFLHGYGTDQIGNTYKTGQPIYDEGAMGNASGNHVHMEFGYGWKQGGYLMTSKTNSKGIYEFACPNKINIEDLFYIPTSYKVYDNGGYSFRNSDISSTSKCPTCGQII